MKKMTKILSLLLALSMVFALCACGSSSAATTAATAAPAAEASDASAEAGYKLSTDGVLTMATNAAFPPYEYIDDDGTTIVGIDAEIAQMIADKLGLTLEIQDIEFSSIITSVQSGKADIGMAGMTVTDERKQNVDFTTTYATGVQSIIVPEGSDIKSADDLAGHKIGVQESTTGHIYCEDDFGAENVTAYSTGALAVQALLDGQVDCVVIDNNPAKAYVEANSGLTILDTEYVSEDYAICVAKDNTALLDAVNTALEELIADGSVQAVLDKYIAAD